MAHQSAQSVPAYVHTLRGELDVEAPDAVGPTAAGIRGSDVRDQTAVLSCTLALGPHQPGVVAARTHPKRSAQGPDGVLPLVIEDELVPQRGSELKIPTAFFRIVFSSLTLASSRWRRAISASWGLP